MAVDYGKTVEELSKLLEKSSPVHAMEDPFLNTEEVSAILRVKPSTLSVWRFKKIGPDWVKMGRLVYYKTSVIRAFIETNSNNISS